MRGWGCRNCPLREEPNKQFYPLTLEKTLRGRREGGPNEALPH